MQEDTSQIGWDPIYVTHPMPWEVRLLVLYLLVVFIILIVRSLGLARQLYYFSASRRTLLQNSSTDDDTANLLAGAALADRVPRGFLLSKTAAVPEDQHATGFLRVLEKAESRFRYIWEISSVAVASMRRLVNLTFLLSAFVLLTGLGRILRRLLGQTVFGLGVLYGVISELLVPFTLGIFVCAALYAAYSFFEGRLLHRRTSWNYLCARIRNGSLVRPPETAGHSS